MIKKPLLAVRLASACLTLLSSAQASARTCDDVQFAEKIEVDGKSLILNGIGIREATIFKVNVFVAGLYIERPSNDGYAIAAADETKRVRMVFSRSVSGEEMAEAIQASFARAVPGELPQLQARIDRFKGLLPSFAEKDVLTVTYRPSKGLEVTTKKGVEIIAGLDFARALFLIWLGDHPPNPELRRGLLGGTCD